MCLSRNIPKGGAVTFDPNGEYTKAVSLDNDKGATNPGMIEEDIQEFSRDSTNENEDEREDLSKEYNLKKEQEDEGTSTFKRMRNDHKIERHFVHHDYHDHSCDLDIFFNGNDKIQVCSSLQKMKHKPNRGGVSVPFPLKLHRMLEHVGIEDLSTIVSWKPHGRCFVVHKPKDFIEFVMPRYFRQTKLTSFQRQLNLYGYRRLTKGRDSGGYYHELFLRDKSFLCQFMTRTKIKGTGTKAASSPDSEPDFYTMPFVDGLAEKNYQDGIVSNTISCEEPTQKRHKQGPSNNEKISPQLSNNIQETKKLLKKDKDDTSRELLWNRPFYYMESLSLTKNRPKSAINNETEGADAKVIRKTSKNFNDPLRNYCEPLINRQEDEDFNKDLFYRDSSLPPFDFVLENDNDDSLRLDDDSSIRCILDLVVS